MTHADEHRRAVKCVAGIKLTTNMTQATPGMFSSKMTDRTKRLIDAENSDRRAAAKTATKTSAATFKAKRPVNSPKRPGRRFADGKLARHVKWSASPSGSMVELNVKTLDRQAPHWIIQEIGTNQRATLKMGGSKNPQGRSKSGSSYVKTIRSQKGRRISAGLAFGSRPSGKYTPPTRKISNQQLYPRKNLKGGGPFRPIFIRKEIEGQHFVRDGAKTGFQEYRTSVRAAARAAFAGQPYRP